jgi:hypothetical protein
MKEITGDIPLDHPIRLHPDKYSERSLNQAERYPYMVPSKCEAKWGVQVRYESAENKWARNKSKSVFFLS